MRIPVTRFYLHPKLARTWDICRRASSWLESFLLRRTTVIGSEVDFLTTFVPSRHSNDVLAQRLSRLSQAAGVGAESQGKIVVNRRACGLNLLVRTQMHAVNELFPITKIYFCKKIFLTFSFHLQVKFVLIF
jgi:hypothetical protein